MRILFSFKREGSSDPGYTCLNLEDITLGEVSPSEDNYCLIPLYEVPGVVKFRETESGMWFPEAGGREK